MYTSRLRLRIFWFPTNRPKTSVIFHFFSLINRRRFIQTIARLYHKHFIFSLLKKKKSKNEKRLNAYLLVYTNQYNFHDNLQLYFSNFQPAILAELFPRVATTRNPNTTRAWFENDVISIFFFLLCSKTITRSVYKIELIEKQLIKFFSPFKIKAVRLRDFLIRPIHAGTVFVITLRYYFQFRSDKILNILTCSVLLKQFLIICLYVALSHRRNACWKENKENFNKLYIPMFRSVKSMSVTHRVHFRRSVFSNALEPLSQTCNVVIESTV